MLGHLLLQVAGALIALFGSRTTSMSHDENLAELRHRISVHECILVANSGWQRLPVALESILGNLEEVAPLLLELLAPLLGEVGGLNLLLVHDGGAIWIPHVLSPGLASIFAADEGDLLALQQPAETGGDNLRLMHKELLLVGVDNEAEALALVVHVHRPDLAAAGLLLLLHHRIHCSSSLKLPLESRVHGARLPRRRGAGAAGSAGAAQNRRPLPPRWCREPPESQTA
mmetsp:Transcript_90613/g.270376  ORF Transcript_90613/g.270376 Transcript_90613/m.270376 type:complete len:229 (-) Transcript_90613:7-693(-)